MARVFQENLGLEVVLDLEKRAFSSECKRLTLYTFVGVPLSLSPQSSDSFPLLELNILLTLPTSWNFTPCVSLTLNLKLLTSQEGLLQLLIPGIFQELHFLFTGPGERGV